MKAPPSLPAGYRMALERCNQGTGEEARDWLTRRERGSAHLLRLMAWVSLHAGRTVSRIALHGIAVYYYFFAPRERAASRDYLSRVLGRPPRALERYRHVLTFATTIHDRVYLAHGRYDLFRITVTGETLMRDTLAAGRGAFLMGAHLGSFEIIGSVGRRQPGMQVTMAMYEENARKISHVLAAISSGARADVIPLGRIDAMMRIAEHLGRGAFVGVLGDRTLGDEPQHEVVFLGDRARLPLGPMRAAAILRRSVIFMAGLYLGGNRYHVVFEPIADFADVAHADREAAVRAAVERYAAVLDRHCRCAPYNWFNYFDFWGRPARAAAP